MKHKNILFKFCCGAAFLHAYTGGFIQATAQDVQLAALQAPAKIQSIKKAHNIHSVSKINLAAQKLLKKKLDMPLRGTIGPKDKNIRLTQRMIDMRKPLNEDNRTLYLLRN